MVIECIMNPFPRFPRRAITFFQSMALVASTSVTTDAQPDDQSTDKDASVPQARSQEKDVHEAGNSEVEAAKDSLASPYCCGVWSLGDPFDDQAKVGAALDKLVTSNSFSGVIVSYHCRGRLFWSPTRVLCR